MTMGPGRCVSGSDASCKKAPDMTEQKTDKTAESETPTRVVQKPMAKEIGGTKGPEPTRYGDWEHKGRCTDF
jgi:hypothetical protein